MFLILNVISFFKNIWKNAKKNLPRVIIKINGEKNISNIKFLKMIFSLQPNTRHFFQLLVL